MLRVNTKEVATGLTLSCIFTAPIPLDVVYLMHKLHSTGKYRQCFNVLGPSRFDLFCIWITRHRTLYQPGRAASEQLVWE